MKQAIILALILGILGLAVLLIGNEIEKNSVIIYNGGFDNK